MGNEKIRLLIFARLVPAIGVLIAISVLAAKWLQERSMADRIDRQIAEVRESFQRQLDKDAELLDGLMVVLKEDPRLHSAWLSRDRETLLELTRPVFERLRRDFRVTHFYFHDVDRVCFLRVHNPPRHGDVIKRFTLAEAVERDKPSHGIELGPFGTFTLRSVQPWRVNGRLIGYVELGEEIEHLSRQVKDVLSVELSFIVHKPLLDRLKWEEGLAVLDKTGQWDRFQDFVVIGTTMERDLPDLDRLMTESRQGQVRAKFRVRDDGPWYRGGFVRLLDAGGQDVGKIAVFADVSKEVLAARRMLAIILGASLIVGGMLTAFFWIFLGGLQNRLNLARESLEAEIQRGQRKQLALGVANDALEQLHETAQGANRAKSEFLANMSHEIRTPITAILGFTDILLTDESIEHASPEQIDALRTVNRNGHYLLELINDILDLSKIEAGRVEMERISVSTTEMITEVIELMKIRTDAKGLDLQVEYDGPLPEKIDTDPTRLRQILINLIDNAVKFTDTGSVRLVTRLARGKHDEPTVQFDVIDTGIGMTPEQCSRLFTPFAQADTSTTRKFGGTGLGLTISKRLAKSLGGDISVVSKLGEGSTFGLTVGVGALDGVVMLDDPISVTAAETRTEPVSAGAECYPPCSVLLAEDGLDNQRLISLLLKRADMKTTVAGNGQLAYDLAMAELNRGVPFDVILMDMQMPVMDGYETTRQLRQSGYEGPIIALTACAMAGDREKCLAAGCDDFTTKPIDRNTLLSTVSRHVQKSRLAKTHEKNDPSPRLADTSVT